MTYSSKVSFLEHENRTKNIIFHQKNKDKGFLVGAHSRKKVCV